MSNILQFPPRVTVEIDGGTVTRSVIEDAAGIRPNPDDIGKTMYFVDVVEADGTRTGMWDGENRAQARLVAEECRRDFGGYIRDLTGGVA